ncbi:MAG TPA: hypothetical protein VN408_22695 [Actinoplanes sp.]|nr:hypothetical protein [Actinoplanes sp.]
MGGQTTVTGAVDPLIRTSETVLTSPWRVTTVRRVDGVKHIGYPPEQPGDPERTWQRFRDTGSGGLTDFDAARLQHSLDTVTTIRWADDDTVSGTIDLFATPDSHSTTPNAS